MDERSEPSCCTTPVDPRIARRFDARASEWREATTFPPMVDVSAVLLGALDDVARLHPTVLELGCGTGALSVALLERGAKHVTGVDLSSTSIEVARRRADAAGAGDRAAFIVANAAATVLKTHDWVVLDRSMCCFADADALVAAAIAAASNRIALSLPESRGWRGVANRIWRGARNAWGGWRGRCPSYVHDLRRIDATLARAGFQGAEGQPHRHGLWFIGLYER